MVKKWLSSLFFRRACLIGLALTLSPLAAFGENVGFMWDPNTEPDLASYKVYQGESPGQYGYSTSVGLQEKFTFDGLQEGKTYYFSVTAVDTAGNESAPSPEVVANISDSTPPTSPVSLNVQSNSSTSLQIAWSPSLDNVGVMEYLIYRENQFIGKTSSMSYEDSPLEPGVEYSYSVQAVDMAGNISVMSEATSGKTPTDAWMLEVSVSGGGTVTSFPQGFICSTASCQTSWSSGQSISLTAKPSRHWTFKGWSGACSGTGECVVALYENENVLAIFERTPKGKGKKRKNS